MRHRPVSVSRPVAAPPEAVFAVVSDSRRHPEIDGSGTLQGVTGEAGPLRLGSVFGMGMRQYGASYRMANLVTEFEPDRLIAWQAMVDVDAARKLGGVTWRYRLRPTPVGCLVTETYDVTTGPGSHVLAAAGFPARMERAMAATLDRLAALVETS